MSNHKSCENQDRRKPKVSVAMTINHGLVGPKVNPKGVTDGQQINISALLKDSIGGTNFSSQRALLDSRLYLKGSCQVNPVGRLQWQSQEMRGIPFLEER